MTRSIVLRDIWWQPDSVHFEFACSEELEWLLWDNRVLSLYCSEGVRSEPEVLAAGFLFAFAPIGWAFQADLVSPVPVPVGVLKSLDAAGKVLRHHYGWPDYDPFSSVRASRDWLLPRHHAGLMFSGGVDSAMALVELRDRLDWLIHVSNFENLDSQTTAEQRISALATTRAAAWDRGLGWMHLRTNLAEIFKHNRFDEKFPKECSFWLGLEHVHHIATALTVIRPLLHTTYLAGGFSELHRWAGSCAASSHFLNTYTFPSPLVLVNELDERQYKVEHLLDRCPELLSALRVCYSSGNGTCSECRKCQDTALMIVSAGGSLCTTSFPADIVPNLIAKAKELKELPAVGHGFFNQALSGRALWGARDERWRQLLELLYSHPRFDKR